VRRDFQEAIAALRGESHHLQELLEAPKREARHFQEEMETQRRRITGPLEALSPEVHRGFQEAIAAARRDPVASRRSSRRRSARLAASRKRWRR